MPGVLLLLGLLWASARDGGRGLTRGEMLICYVCVSTTVTVAGYNFLQVFVPALGSAHYLAPANRWQELLPFYPEWLVPRDEAALARLFSGESGVPWEVWLPLLAWWSTFLLAMGLAGLAGATLLSDGWIRRERLTFPIAAIPLEVSQPGTPLFRQRSFWICFLVPAALQSLLALNYYFPSVPAIPLKHQEVSQGLVDPPWVALRPLALGHTPFITGLAYLAPLDVSFSIWFFYWLGKAQRLVALLGGWVDPSDLGASGEPHLSDQTIGAFLALGLLLLVRAHLSARRGPRPERGTNPGDPWLGRAAVMVLAACSLYAFSFMVAAGFAPLLAAALLVVYGLTVITIARVRAEAGFAWAYGPDRFTASLSQVVVDGAGTAAFPPRSIALLGLFHWFWWDLRFALFPAQMEALKIADEAQIARRRMVGLLALALVVGLAVSLYAVMVDSYRFGWGTARVYIGPQMGARLGYTLADGWLENGAPPRWDRVLWAGIGGAVTLALGLLRGHFPWWPFHPIGYVMAATPTAYAFWSNYLLAWAVKAAVLRYGGAQLYRRSLPLVFGLILGDISTQTLWSLGATLLDAPVYQFVS